MRKIIVLLLLILPINIYSQEKVVFATVKCTPFISDIVPGSGAAGELLRAICIAGGIEAEYRNVPLKRAEKMVEYGKAFAAFPNKSMHKNLYTTSDPIYNCSKYFFTNKDNPKTKNFETYNTLNDLKIFNIGLMSDYYYLDEFEDNGLNITIFEDNTDAIKNLESGSIDLLLHEKSSFYFYEKKICKFHQNNNCKFTKIDKEYGGKKPQFLIVSDKYPDYELILSKFNNGLHIIRSNGKYQRLVKEHNLDPVSY